MFSKNKTLDFVSRILSDEGFRVEKEFKIGNRFYVDIVGTKENKAIIIEIKPAGFKLDQSDLMQISGYIGALRKTREFENMTISGCVVASGGTIPPATPLGSDLGIHVIDSYKEKEIEKEIKKCTRAE